MADIVVKDILQAGVHFGHKTSKWNPKMRPYIYGRRNQIHIIDLKETVRGLLRARKYLQTVAANGSLVLFVGTKRQAQETVQEIAEKCGMPYCTERWLGGTLTNFRTVRSRLKRLEELEALESSGELATYSKKAQSRLLRELRKIRRNLGGIRDMNRIPEAVIVVDPKKEHNCVRECRILGVKVVALIDTDSDPDDVDLPIPGNDDSIRSIRLLLSYLGDAIASGKSTPDAGQVGTAPGAGRRWRRRLQAGSEHRLSRDGSLTGEPVDLLECRGGTSCAVPLRDRPRYDTPPGRGRGGERPAVLLFSSSTDSASVPRRSSPAPGRRDTAPEPWISGPASDNVGSDEEAS